MVKPPRTWEYILIELEIDGKVIDSRIASRFLFNSLYNSLLTEAQTQTLPWAIFISKFYYTKPKVFDGRDRDENGRYIKTKNIENARDIIQRETYWY